MDKAIILTLFGTGKNIKDFTVTLLDKDGYEYRQNTAQDYCNNINELELTDDNWNYATIIRENQKIRFEKPERYTDFGILSSLDDRTIQKVLREIDCMELANALTSANKDILSAVLRNMSKREAKMIIESMEYNTSIPKGAIKEAQRKIVELIRHMEKTGEITVPKFGQDN
jgi:Mg/Co/Ni transporter MgtE